MNNNNSTAEKLIEELVIDEIEISQDQYNALQNKLEKLKKLFNSGALGGIKKEQLSFSEPL